MLSDGYGTIVELGGGASDENPTRWAITGSTRLFHLGTAQKYIFVHKDEGVPPPKHLPAMGGTALPLVRLTALMTKASVKPGQNILVTGVDGGVGLPALHSRVALGAGV